MATSLKTIFISRQLAADSPFLQQLEGIDCTVIGQSLLVFSPLPFRSVPSADWIFFYSRNAVRFFFEQLNVATTLPSLAVIGSGTGRALENWGARPDFVGTGDPQTTAKFFLEQARGQRVLFVQAEHSQRSVENLLQADLEAIPFPVYHNKFKTDFDIPECDFLVFTSPMNVRAYFEKNDFLPQQQLIAIGQTTANALRALDIGPITVAASSDERALALAVIHLVKLKN